MHKAYKNDIKAMPEWASAKLIHETRGITAPQLRRYAREGLIRTSNILRPGHARGKRLFNVIDLDNLIERSIEPCPVVPGAETVHRQPMEGTRESSAA